MRDTLKQIYKQFVDKVILNPLYKLDQPIQSESFNREVDQIFRGSFSVGVINPTVALQTPASALAATSTTSAQTSSIHSSMTGNSHPGMSIGRWNEMRNNKEKRYLSFFFRSFILLFIHSLFCFSPLLLLLLLLWPFRFSENESTCSSLVDSGSGRILRLLDARWDDQELRKMRHKVQPATTPTSLPLLWSCLLQKVHKDTHRPPSGVRLRRASESLRDLLANHSGKIRRLRFELSHKCSPGPWKGSQSLWGSELYNFWWKQTLKNEIAQRRGPSGRTRGTPREQKKKDNGKKVL